MLPDGKIVELSKEQEKELQEFIRMKLIVPVQQREMTAKQRRLRQVSPRDSRSVLGKRLGKMRNNPCPCGSGKKFKKCCLGRMQSRAGVADSC